jgi:acyl-coenzyme A synthetase/AMP-(fatty) acid ligase
VLSPERPPHLLVLGEMSFSGFFFFITNQLCIGGPVVLIGTAPSVDDLIKAIGEWDDAAFLATPAMCRSMLAKATADAALFPKARAIFAGASPLFAEEKRVMAKRLTLNFYEVYGNAATGFLSTLPPAEITDRAESVGRIAPGVTLEIVDANGAAVPPGMSGHVRCRGPGISEKFCGPDADAGAARLEGFVDGWYYPGDVASRDAQGYLYLKGRVSDLIRRRGIEIFPPEIEEVLTRHPNVAEVAVVDLPVTGGESEIVAVIVARGQSDFAAVADHCRAHLPPEKYPSQIFWTEQIPKVGPGKVDKPALRASIIKKMQSAVPASTPEHRPRSELRCP